MSDLSRYNGCFVEPEGDGWRVCARNGEPLEPIFDTRAAAEQARKGWQDLFEQIKDDVG